MLNLYKNNPREREKKGLTENPKKQKATIFSHRTNGSVEHEDKEAQPLLARAANY